ncbi:MAG: methylated-DNA--[protein]-cysteine S-methyltransferase [Candidatus Cloacimonetes bacterium]|nr:methylated-DNA--[protein]-cysteine S-methyltransferase [Candidatus Cloacimonadota bacterium]
MPQKCWRSPLGWMRIEERGGRVWSVRFVLHCDEGGDTPLLSQAALQLEEWFAHTRQRFDLPLAQRGTPFQRRVWEALRLLPPGQTITYGQLAAQLGDKRKARAVGGAVAANPWLLLVPCHRVLPARGGVGGYSGGTERKRDLLRLGNM